VFFLKISKNGQKVKRTAGERAAFAAILPPNIEKRAHKSTAARSGAVAFARCCRFLRRLSVYAAFVFNNRT
jgi:hypothetical protein